MTLHSDYVRWHALQVSSGDIDPMYPVLRRIAADRGVDPIRACFLHVTWYHAGSTIAAMSLDNATAEDLLSLPCGTERRGHRDGRALLKHVEGLPRDPRAWVLRALGDRTGAEGWERVSEALLTLPGNGRWAAYKTTEMLQKVAGLDITAPDAGHRYSTGPRKGLARLHPGLDLGNTAEVIAKLDALTNFWSAELGEPDLAQIETSLCDFNSLCSGRYYLGHDIDSMQDQWGHPAVRDFIEPGDWEARRASFDARYLGELQGWTGIRAGLKRIYADRGEIRV